jgi:hypothetical protein
LFDIYQTHAQRADVSQSDIEAFVLDIGTRYGKSPLKAAHQQVEFARLTNMGPATFALFYGVPAEWRDEPPFCVHCRVPINEDDYDRWIRAGGQGF